MQISKSILKNLFYKKEQIIGIVGENGSGKTTFAKYISGFLIKDNEEDKINTDIALLLQNPYQQFVGRTLFDELTFLLEQEQIKENKIKEILDLYEYDLNKKLIELSGGQAQEVLINNFLISKKKYLICDENFSNLDEEKKEFIFNKIRNSNKKIILITNNIYDLHFCDKVYELKENFLNLKNIEIKKESFLKNNLEDVLFLKNIKNFKIKNPQNLTFKYGINLLVGKSGIGKSTIFEILCNFQKYNGDIINPLKGTFILSQYPNEQITTTKVKEEFVQNEELLNMFDKFELNKDILDKDIVDLSTGELTQVLMIKALLGKDELILLDESFEVLDFNKQQIILNLLKEIDNRVIICITHNKRIFNDVKVNFVEVK